MSKMERKDATDGRAPPESAAAESRPGSPMIVLLGVVAVAAMALGLVIGFLLGLLF